MEHNSSKPAKSAWIGLALIVVTLGLIFALARLESTASRAQPLPVLGEVSDFTLTNQAGQRATLADLRGTVWVADIILEQIKPTLLAAIAQLEREP